MLTNGTYLFIGVFIVLAIAVLWYDTRTENMTSTCVDCMGRYNRCITRARHDSKNVEDAINECGLKYLCGDDCKHCDNGTVQCKPKGMNCKDPITVSNQCRNADPTGTYFDPTVCESQLISICNDPDTEREICDPDGTFLDSTGKPACCTFCEPYKRTPTSPLNPKKVRPCRHQPHHHKNSPLPLSPSNSPLPLSPSNSPLPLSPSNSPLPLSPSNSPDYKIQGTLFKYNDTEYFGDTIPPFQYPTDLQQPAGPKGWGYRNPQATFRTLMWEQNQPMQLMPPAQPVQTPMGYRTHLVESAPVHKQHSPFEATAMRPVVPNIRPRAVATAPYANWASSLSA